tara:strand:+ start:10041 stop:10493 length:453 start_codon:yes stop_codon:yes gene_type:complete
MNYKRVFEETFVYDFGIEDCLNAFMWSHMKMPNCTQSDKSDENIIFYITKSLPSIVESIFGSTIKITEQANITETGFVSVSKGSLPGSEFKSVMNFEKINDTSALNITVDIAWNEGISEFVKEAIKSFVITEIKTWRKSLPLHLEDMKKN